MVVGKGRGREETIANSNVFSAHRLLSLPAPPTYSPRDTTFFESRSNTTALEP